MPCHSPDNINTRSPSVILDRYTGCDEQMITPRWAETLVFGEEYEIFESHIIITRLLFKHALREVNLEVVGPPFAHLFIRSRPSVARAFSRHNTVGLSGNSKFVI